MTSRLRSDLSVIIPSYNAARFLAEALDSVLRQTLGAGEVVVVDDGSTDDTASVVRRYGDHMRYVFQENRGPAAARNSGLRQTTGRLVAFLDADDAWAPTKLETQVAYLEAHPEYAAVYTDLSEVDARGDVLQASKFAGVPGAGREGWILEEILLGGFIFTQTVLMWRWVFDTIGLFDEGLQPSDDRDLFIRVASRFQIGCVRAPLVKRRRHDTNISNNFMERMFRTDCLALEKALTEIEMNTMLREKVHRHLGGLYLRLGQHDLGRGRGALARTELRRGLALAGGRRWEALLLPLTFAPPQLLLGLHLLKASAQDAAR